MYPISNLPLCIYFRTHDYNQDFLTENEGSSLSSFIDDGEIPDSEWEEDGGGSPVNDKPDRKRKVSV